MAQQDNDAEPHDLPDEFGSLEPPVETVGRPEPVFSPSPLYDDVAPGSDIDDRPVHKPTMPQKWRWIITIFGLAFGSIFLSAGLFAWSSIKAHDDGVIVVGRTVDVVSAGDETYAPVVEFIDPATGQTHTVERQVSSSSRPAIGDSWDVSVVPGDPLDARVLGRWDWVFAGIFIGIGGVVLALVAFGLGVNLLRRFRNRVSL